jgi:hypothetical protein
VVQTKRLASGLKFTGGMSSWSKVIPEIQTLLRDSSAFLTTMFDLYGLPADTPGLASTTNQPPHQRAVMIEAAIAAEFIENGHFRPYLQVHEFEALVFVDPPVAAKKANDSQVEKALRLAVEHAGEPELVNDNPNTAPSKRLLAVWPDYVKTVDGVAIVAEVGLIRLRAKCPHFGQWLDWFDLLAE